MAKRDYKPEFLKFLQENNLGTPSAAIALMRCLGLKFQDSRVLDVAKKEGSGGVPGAYFHHKKSQRLIGGEWLNYDRMCELILQAKNKTNKANGVEPKQSKEERVAQRIREYEGRVEAQIVSACKRFQCFTAEQGHGKESGNFFVKVKPKRSTSDPADLVINCSAIILHHALIDAAVTGHKVTANVALNRTFAQVTIDSSHVRAAITKNVEKDMAEGQGELPIGDEV